MDFSSPSPSTTANAADGGLNMISTPLSVPSASARGNSLDSTRRRTSASQSSASPARQRQFQCQQCGQAFARLLHLQRHEYRHVDLRPFECPGCDKTFSRQDSLVRHARLHKDLLPLGALLAGQQRKHNKACMSCTDTAKCMRCAKYARRQSSTRAPRKRRSKATTKPAPQPSDGLGTATSPAVVASPASLWPTVGGTTSKDPVVGIGPDDDNSAQQLGFNQVQDTYPQSPLTTAFRQVPDLSPSSSSGAVASPTLNPYHLVSQSSTLSYAPRSQSMASGMSRSSTMTDQIPALSPSYSTFSDDVLFPPSPTKASLTLPSVPRPPPEDIKLESQLYAHDMTAGGYSMDSAVPPSAGSATQAFEVQNMPPPLTLNPTPMGEQDNMSTDAFQQVRLQMEAIRNFMTENMVAYVSRRLPPQAMMIPPPMGLPEGASERDAWCVPPQAQGVPLPPLSSTVLPLGQVNLEADPCGVTNSIRAQGCCAKPVDDPLDELQRQLTQVCPPMDKEWGMETMLDPHDVYNLDGMADLIHC